MHERLDYVSGCMKRAPSTCGGGGLDCTTRQPHRDAMGRKCDEKLDFCVAHGNCFDQMIFLWGKH